MSFKKAGALLLLISVVKYAYPDPCKTAIATTKTTPNEQVMTDKRTTASGS
jgi:hypothetical protein